MRIHPSSAGWALLASFIIPSSAHAVQALGDSYEIQQPDGSAFSAADRGDEWRNWIENQAGFAVAPDANGVWRYVKAYDASGNPVLESTPATGNPPPGLTKHIAPPSRRPAGAPGLGTTSVAGTADASPSAAPVSSTRPILFILAQFTDRSGSTSTSSWAGFVANNIGDYFAKTSHGNAVVHGANETQGTANDGVVGWVNIGYPHPDTRDNTDTRNKQLARDAIAAADPYVNYASYDTNGDGYVEGDELGVVVIAAGYERSYSSGYTPNVWGHRWNTYIAGSGYAQADGVRVTDYAQFGELHGTHQATMGIMVHELGHLIYGLPDLYDYDGSSSGIGAFGLMGSGSWGQASSDPYAGQTPVNACGWTKYRLNWVNATEGAGAVTIMASGDPSASDYRVYRGSSGTSTQYFLVENRQPLGYDLGLQRYLGSSFGGLAIWHVDDTRTNNDNDANRWVDLEEADGNQMGTGRGYKAALWASPNATTFNDTSTPDSRLYNGSSSDVSVTDISASSTAMTASFSGAVTNAPPTADFSSSVTGLTASFTDNSTDSDGSVVSWAWTFGDGGTSTQPNPSHTYAAGGIYSVTLTVTDDTGDSDSVSKSVSVNLPNTPPTADYSSSVSGLTATFTDASTDSDGTIAAWAWTFGDGGTSTARNPIHSYAAAGTYNVTLTVTDDDGDTGSTTKPVTVTAPVTEPPAAPTGMTAVDSANGTALLSWTDNSDNESGFEIQRQDWHPKRQVWKSAIWIGATAADVTGFTDASGTGRFRYSVRAYNSTDSSAWSDWAEIDVTDTGGGTKPCRGKKCP